MVDTLSSPQSVAVVGIAAQLPCGSWADTDVDYRAFFDFLLNKGEAYGPIPATRFNIQNIRGRATGQVLPDTGAFLKNLDLFDHKEFGVSAKDARLMPLSVRKLIEVTFLSLCDSGIDYRGKNVGCFMSGVAHDMFTISGHDDAEATGSFGNIPATIANRVSYHLDLRGPTVPLDTACSSTLYATHLAVQALRNGECDSAVVGGCQINHRFTDWLSYTQGGILSPDGKCKPFDVSANGFGRGEGVVAIVLKPLDAALRDSDHIYATILGTGINSSGALVPANAPSAVAQRDAMLRAFRQAERNPQEVDFVELHATGTAQGDPTEANWVGEEFKRDEELVIGSVKGNIGHLEIPAFLASLCKVCGILETGLIPPNVNLKKQNPAIRWSQYRLRVPVDTEPLKCRAPSGRPLIAMTSSGIGGANGHAVVEGPPARTPATSFWTEGTETPTLLVAGGLSPRSAAAISDMLVDVAQASNEKAALARLFGRRARSMTWRSFSVVGPARTLEFSKPQITPKVKAPIVFVFSGQGTQHFQMGRELFRSCAPFRASILELDQAYASIVGRSLIEETGLFVDAPADAKDPFGDPWPIAITLPALTMLQLALIDTLAAAGVSPDVVVGHSAGETAVLYASGAASKTAALELAIARGRAFTVVEDAKGTMAAVNCSPDAARKILEEVRAELGAGILEIGCFNTPGAVTLSGTETHIDLAVAIATAAGVFARKLRTRVPVHSEMMELCRAEFSKLVEDVFARHEVSLPKAEVYSTMTGQAFDGKFDARYYWDGTVGPVRFTEAIQAMTAKHRGATFVELGPHPVLTSYIHTMTQDRQNITITCPLRRPRAPETEVEVFELMTALGKIVSAGNNCVDFDTLYTAGQTFSGSLPKYPFDLQPLPWLVPSAEIARQRQHRNGPMNHPQLQINARTHPGLADHIIKGEPIMPAAGFVEMALEFGANVVYNAEFHSMFALSSDRPVPVQVKLEGSRWTVSSATSTDYATAWPVQYNRLHASGYLSTMPPIEVAPLDLNSIRNRMKPVNTNALYNELGSFAQFGRMYRRIRKCHMTTGPLGTIEALMEIRARGDDIPSFQDYRLHPAILDAAVHAVINPRMTGNHDPNLYHLPSRISAVKLCPEFEKKPFPAIIYSYARSVGWTPDTLTYNFILTNESGIPLCVVEELELTLHGYQKKRVEKRFDMAYRPTEITLAAFKNPSISSVTRQHSVPPSKAQPNGHIPQPNGRISQPNGRISSAETDKAESAIIIPYVRGEELKIQKQISLHDPLHPLSLLFIAEDGLNGDASEGFTRSLRKEFPMWTIRLAVFDASWTTPQREAAAKTLVALHTEEVEFRVAADGSISSPRIELADPPSAHLPLDSGNAWAMKNGEIIQTHIPQAAENHLVVHVDSVASYAGEHWAFIGTAQPDTRMVLGLASGPIRSHVVAHKGAVAEVDASILAKVTSVGPPVLASTLVALSVGPLALANPERLRGLHVLVLDDDDELRAQIRDICVRLGMEVLSVPSVGLDTCYLERPSFIISGTTDARQVTLLRSILAPRGRMTLWNLQQEGLVFLAANDPWAIGDALRHALTCPVNAGVRYKPVSELLTSVTSSTAQFLELLDPTKSYLLVGGIGSLGLHIALWMYQNGAREIILTSRSGAASVDERGDFIAQRTLAYLRGRADLSLKVIAADSTSHDDMSSLVRSITRPLGGCMLLSGVLSDGMFASHTAESFEKALTPKLQGFAILEQVVDIGSLDFVVALSSMAGLFGNTGQTNYAAANSALAGMTKKYKNAFSIMAPLILDSSWLLMSDDSHHNSRLRHAAKWGMTARELCKYIGDGILKLRDGPVWQYIPDFDWKAVRENMGFARAYEHLVPKDVEGGERNKGEEKPSLRAIVCRILDLKDSDLSADVPLTTYGLDSLSATALSYALAPLVALTQLQLLADITVKDIQVKIDTVGSK